ncbi:MAG: trypsin-like serine protease, partial [Myxococcota bacterium]
MFGVLVFTACSEGVPDGGEAEGQRATSESALRRANEDSPAQYPFVIRIDFPNPSGGGNLFCTASAISDRLLLTAAHCIDQTIRGCSDGVVTPLAAVTQQNVSGSYQSSATVQARFPDATLSSNPASWSWTQTIPVIGMVTHPAYEPPVFDGCCNGTLCDSCNFDWDLPSFGGANTRDLALVYLERSLPAYIYENAPPVLTVVREPGPPGQTPFTPDTALGEALLNVSDFTTGQDVVMVGTSLFNLGQPRRAWGTATSYVKTNPTNISRGCDPTGVNNLATKGQLTLNSNSPNAKVEGGDSGGPAILDDGNGSDIADRGPARVSSLHFRVRAVGVEGELALGRQVVYASRIATPG